MSFQSMKLPLLRCAYFAESVSYVPAAGGDAVSLTALVRREPDAVQRDEYGSFVTSRATVVCLATVHATLGGIVAPAVGDNWTLAKTKDGAAISGWMSGAPLGNRGGWEIPVVKRERIETGGKRKVGA